MLPYAEASKQAEAEEEEPYDYEKAKKVKWYHQILLNRPLKVIIVLLLTAVAAPLLVYNFIFLANKDPTGGRSLGSCLVPRSARLLCGVGFVNATECHSECCFDPSNHICYHRFPSRFSYITDTGWDQGVLLEPRNPTVPYRNQESVPHIRISIDEISSTHLTLTFYHSEETVLEGRRLENTSYVYAISTPEVNVIVNGTHDNILFNTVRGPLIASNDIWEIAFRLTRDTMYGLGEIPLEEGTVKIIYSNREGLSSIPLIFAKSNDSYHGLLIDIMEPTEVRVQGENQIAIRSITRKSLKFHLFVGPKPSDIMRDVMKIIGFNNELEYWMMGAHICSEVSETPQEAFEDFSEFLTNADKEKLPFESHCGATPVVFHNEPCEMEDDDYVEEGAKALEDFNKRFVPHVSPYIRYEADTLEETSAETTTASETETEVHIAAAEKTTHVVEETIHLYQNEEEVTEAQPVCSNIVGDFKNLMLHHFNSTEMYTGRIGNHSVIYPDYEKATEEFVRKLWRYKCKISGMVVENSWPLDESYKFQDESEENSESTETINMRDKMHELLPYFNEHFEEAFNPTPLWNIKRPNGTQYYMYSHNEYGNNFATAFKKANEEVTLWSSSQWMNGEVGINRQNIRTSWTNLQKELVEAALGGISGHWLWSTPICGDTDNFDSTTHINLCVKWYMAATYMPLIKIHSKSILRHPLAFVGINRLYMTTALNQRLSFLPYFYTTFQNGPLLRPMFYQFPYSERLKDLKSQFSVGDDLLIVPNLLPSQTHVHVWMPPGSWYEIWSGLALDAEEGEAVTMTTTTADFLTLIRGGSIVVMQKDVKELAEETRRSSDFSLIIALECKIVDIIDGDDDDNDEGIDDNIISGNVTICHASGSLYMTKNMTIRFESDAETLTITAEGDDFKVFCDEEEAIWANIVKQLNIYGLNRYRNNYDHFRHIKSLSINLCELKTEPELSYTYFIPIQPRN